MEFNTEKIGDIVNRKEIIEMMNWNQNETIQMNAINLAKEDDNLEYWIQPDHYKYSWENCAKVVISKNDQVLSKHLIKILEWLKDINWPGALSILERLKQFESELLKKDLEKTILIANKQHDIEWLSSLSELWEVKKIRNVLEESVKNILKNAYNRFH